MTQVAWDVVAAETLEQIIAVLVHRDHPRAQRIRASRGDQGIDILDPVSEDQEDIYQVKRFTSSLSTSRKRHIAESFERVRSQRADRIRHWMLVLPMDRTTEMDDWFAALTADAAFPCSWMGLTFLDGLAARYPDVIDYYLGDGRSKLEAQLRDLSSLTGLRQAMEPDTPIRSAEAVELVAGVTWAANRLDPHFSYELQAGPVQPTTDELLSKRGAIGSFSRWDGVTSATVTIFPKYDEALQDRPIPITANLYYVPESPVGIAIERFLDYGTAVDLPEGVVQDLRIDLPGGLGGTFTSVSARLMPVMRGAKVDLPPLRAEIFDPDGAPISNLIFTMTAATGGPRGGRSVTGHDLASLVGIELFMTKPGGERSGSFSLHALEIFGKSVRTIHESVRFLHALQSGNRVELATFDGERFAKSNTIGDEFGDNRHLESVLAVVEDLLILQKFTTTRLLLPSSLTPEESAGIREAARLANGERLVGTWTNITVNIFADKLQNMRAQLEQPMAIAMEADCSIELAGAKIKLGTTRQIAASARMASEPVRSEDGHTYRCLLTPGTSNSLETVLLTTTAAPKPN